MRMTSATSFSRCGKRDLRSVQGWSRIERPGKGSRQDKYKLPLLLGSFAGRRGRRPLHILLRQSAATASVLHFLVAYAILIAKR